MKLNTRIATALERPMDRSGFLKLALGLVIGLIGLPRFLAMINDQEPQATGTRDGGYGSSPYGR